MHPSDTAWSNELTTSGDEQAVPAKILIPRLLTVIIALAGLAGNAVVLWLLGFRTRRNPFSVYILNLAGADCLFLCCQVILPLHRITALYSVRINLYDIAFSVSVFAYISGLSILSAISMERCLSVLWPIWYRCRRPRHLSAIMCALLWALSLLLSILEGTYCGILTRYWHKFWCQVLDYTSVAWLILLFVLLSGSSLALMTRLLCGSQRVTLTRLYVTVMLTVLVFLLCGLPFGVYWFLLYWFVPYSDELDPLYLVGGLSCVNSCANPIIYFFVGSFRQRWRKGRKTLRLVLQRALQDTPEGQEHGESLPQGTLEMSGSTLMS